MNAPSKPDTDALVISVEAASKRRAFQAEQLHRLGIVFEFLNAVEPARVAAKELEDRKTRWGRPLGDGEVACLLSHRQAWQRVAAGVHPRLILEDDAVLAGDAGALVAALSQAEGVDYVTLETFTRPKRLARRGRSVLDGRYTLSRLYHDRGGAAAYVLWPGGARKLLRYTERLSPLADAALNVAPNVNRFQVEPAAAIQAMFVAGKASAVETSAVSGGERPRFQSRLLYLRGKFIRLKVSLRLLWRSLATWRVASERAVPFQE